MLQGSFGLCHLLQVHDIHHSGAVLCPFCWNREPCRQMHPVPGWLRVVLLDLWAWSSQSAGIQGLQLDLWAVQLGFICLSSSVTDRGNSHPAPVAVAALWSWAEPACSVGALLFPRTVGAGLFLPVLHVLPPPPFI